MQVQVQDATFDCGGFAYIAPRAGAYRIGLLYESDPRLEGLFTFSSRGPTEDGNMQPNLVAPGSAVSTFGLWTRIT